MISIERIFTVSKSPGAVFAYLSDFTTTEKWDPGTLTTVRTDTGPLHEGSTFHNTSEFRGRRTELDYRLMTFERDSHLVFTGENKTVEATDDLSFAASADGSTTITYRARFRFKGLARLAEPLLRRGFEPLADDTVRQLSATLESTL